MTTYAPNRLACAEAACTGCGNLLQIGEAVAVHPSGSWGVCPDCEGVVELTNDFTMLAGLRRTLARTVSF